MDVEPLDTEGWLYYVLQGLPVLYLAILEKKFTEV